MSTNNGTPRPMSREEAPRYGVVCYPGGRRIEVASDFVEWNDWAVRVLNEAADAERREAQD